MKNWITAILLSVASVLLAGCATTQTFRSEVTSFHEVPLDLQDKSYVFERSKDQDNNLEYRSYENLVRAQLQRLGFTEAPNPQAARLKASLSYSISARDVRVIEPVVTRPYGPYWDPYWPYWRGYGPFYSPFYDPFWYGPPVVQQRDRSFQIYTRRLKFDLARASDGKKLYDVTVVSEGVNGTLAAVMPYMVQAAFADFPGPSGVPRVIEVKVKE